MTSDQELLRRYVDERAEAAFAELVRRHLSMVYGAALRQLSDNQALAEDVAQLVFIALARKAPALQHHPAVSGWLYLSTRHQAATARRARKRLLIREAEANAMNESPTHALESADWTRLRPTIDDALHRLNADDREAILLRYFEDRPFSEVAATLRVPEETARKRVQRSLAKLQILLERRGITSTTGALSAALTGNAATVPAGLGSSIVAAVASLGASAPVEVGLASALLMALKNVAVPVAVLAGALATVALKRGENENQRILLDALQAERTQLLARLGNAQLPVAQPEAASPVAAPPATTSQAASGPAELEGNPGHLSAARISGMGNARRAFAGILAQLNLTSAEQYYFLNYMIDFNNFTTSGRVNALGWMGDPKENLRLYELFNENAMADFYPRLRTLLGDERFSIWLDWKNTAPDRPAMNRVIALDADMKGVGSAGLDESQFTALAQILGRSGPEMSVIAGLPMAYVTQMPISPDAVREAAPILSPDQLEVLARVAKANANIY